MPYSTARRREKKKPSSFYCVEGQWQEPTLCLVFWLEASTFALWDGCLQAGRDEHPSGRGQQKENTDFTKQSDSARFHWTWHRARARHAVECLCGSWHFNDLISLGRIFLWVVSSVIGSIKWSCCVMMDSLYLPLHVLRFQPQTLQVISCNPLKETLFND